MTIRGLARARLGRLLCFLGLHETRRRHSIYRRIAITSEECTRDGCAQLPKVVDLRIRPWRCTCRRHNVSPFCPQHGTFPEETAAAA